MRFLLVTFVLLASVCRAVSGLMPLTAKEIGLMLRSGYSSEAVMRELSARHFADSFDSIVEKQLVQSGANQSLIDALRSGTYKLSSSEMAAAKEKLADKEQREVRAAEQSRESGPPQQSAPAPARSASKAFEVGAPGMTYQLLKGDLVYWHQGTLSHFDNETLEHKKLYLFFFSANWSPQGRKFTPQLVEYYNRVTPQHPEFEVIFFSGDRSQFGMETYMTQSKMPWPAADYERLATKDVIQKDVVHSIPCLVLVDAGGNIISNSYAGEKDLGPEKVLADLDKIFARGNDGRVVRRP